MILEKLPLIKKISGKTTKEIAELSGVPVGTLNKLFSGETQDPKLNTIKAVVNSLGYTLDDLDDKNEILTNNEKALVELYRKLSPSKQDEAQRFISYLISAK